MKLFSKSSTKDIKRLELKVSDATKSAPEPEGGFRLLPLELIDDPQRPLRSDLTEESLAELVLSIKQMGIIEPIIVRPQGNRFEVIAGHRRLSAAALAGLATLPCIIKNIGN